MILLPLPPIISSLFSMAADQPHYTIIDIITAASMSTTTATIYISTATTDTATVISVAATYCHYHDG